MLKHSSFQYKSNVAEERLEEYVRDREMYKNYNIFRCQLIFRLLGKKTKHMHKDMAFINTY